MKSKILLYLFLTVSSLNFAQQSTFNKEAELQRFVERGGKAEEISTNIYKLTYIDGTQRVLNFNPVTNQNSYIKDFDTTVINVWEIDTTKYNTRFCFWQRVDIYNMNYYTPPLVDDLNRNGVPEIYGIHNLAGPVEIFEKNTTGIYESIYTYANSETVGLQAMGEIHGTGEKEIYMWHRDSTNGVIYKSDSIGMLPITFDFFFYYKTLGIIYNMTLGDFDKNKITDAAFNANFNKILIGEFRDSLNNFTTLYEKITSDTTQGNVPSGFAIYDFDSDGKIELIAGSTQGVIYSIEAIDENLYDLVWQGNFSSYNAYMKTLTNDIDGNGKPEFWIGGQDFVEGITRFQTYEATADNNYETVALIELRYINSLYTNYLQAKDVDGDGKEEVIISLANMILILKFNGTPNHHHYEIYYVKMEEATQLGGEFEPLTLADLDGDSKIDLLLPLSKYENGQTLIFSYILKNNGIMGVESLNTNLDFIEDYLKSYPVPFNSTSSIKFYISKESTAKIKVYNSLGKEIKTLLNEKLSPGEYKIQWEAEDKYSIPLPSGIYFISLQTEHVIKTIKTIFLK